MEVGIKTPAPLHRINGMHSQREQVVGGQVELTAAALENIVRGRVLDTTPTVKRNRMICHVAPYPPVVLGDNHVPAGLLCYCLSMLHPTRPFAKAQGCGLGTACQPY